MRVILSEAKNLGYQEQRPFAAAQGVAIGIVIQSQKLF